jgi:radical SAM protein with 4Fe4S-binding SPASM domain
VVEVSVYGATEETYESVTGVAGSYRQCMDGIHRLLDRGTRLYLKTMAMKSNVHELEAMGSLASELGVFFRFDTMLNPGLDGGMAPAEFRLPVDEVLELDLADASRMDGWGELVRKFPGGDGDSDRVFQCGAGISTFNIDPRGRLGVCMLCRGEVFDLRKGTFRQGWNEFVPSVLSRMWSREVPCRECRIRSLCGQCPGWGLLEHGDPEEPVEYLCSVASGRASMLGLEPPPAYDTGRHNGEQE